MEVVAAARHQKGWRIESMVNRNTVPDHDDELLPVLMATLPVHYAHKGQLEKMATSGDLIWQQRTVIITHNAILLGRPGLFLVEHCS